MQKQPSGRYKDCVYSDRTGIELYVMDSDGKNVRRLTQFPGYDGGAFFSPDSKKLVFRAYHIQDPKDLSDYQELLRQNLVRPFHLDIYTMNADGSNMVQITDNAAANFCPFFHPDGKRIIFASNMNDPTKRNFDLFLIGADGNGLEQITFHPTFDGFPMFSPDGKQVVFASNRNGKTPGETNIFTDWSTIPSYQQTRLRNDVSSVCG
jgi:Tol biopolymer transport system component